MKFVPEVDPLVKKMERRKALEAEWSQRNENPLEYYKDGSRYKAWWEHRCECGELHEWQTEVRVRFLGSGCPICSGLGKYKICIFRSLAKVRPDLASEWHSCNEFSPEEILPNSNRKIWWKCNKSNCHHPHAWETVVSHRTRGLGCPYCSGQKICECNSLAKLRPDLLDEWHPENKIKPDEVPLGSHKKVLWRCINKKCQCKHEWTAYVFNRTLNGSGCPYCAGNLFCPCNSLKELYPDLCLEWSEKNSISPDEVPKGTAKKFWWKCNKNHQWKASVLSRTNKKTGCPICNMSHGEKYIKKILDAGSITYIQNKIFSFKNVTNLYFDFYLPEHNKAIEFDGVQHFKPVKFFRGKSGFDRQVINDNRKNEYCSENEISLLRIHYKDQEEIPFLLDSLLSEDDPPFQMLSCSYP